MKKFDFLNRPVNPNIKDPHSKADEPDHLLRQEMPIKPIATQSREGGKVFCRPSPGASVDIPSPFKGEVGGGWVEREGFP